VKPSKNGFLPEITVGIEINNLSHYGMTGHRVEVFVPYEPEKTDDSADDPLKPGDLVSWIHKPEKGGKSKKLEGTIVKICEENEDEEYSENVWAVVRTIGSRYTSQVQIDDLKKVMTEDPNDDSEEDDYKKGDRIQFKYNKKILTGTITRILLGSKMLEVKPDKMKVKLLTINREYLLGFAEFAEFNSETRCLQLSERERKK
jgi:hypothetical protein